MSKLFDLKYRQAKHEFMRAYCTYHLKKHGLNVDKAAEATGFSRAQFYVWARKFGIKLRGRHP